MTSPKKAAAVSRTKADKADKADKTGFARNRKSSPRLAAAGRPQAMGHQPSGLDVDLLVKIVRRHVTLTPKMGRNLRADLHLAMQELAPKPRRTRTAAAPLVPEGDRVLTTQEAADMVGVSRPFMAARIDAGDVPLFQQVGNQRRVLASAVQAWHQRSRQRQRVALTALMHVIEGEYDEE